MSKSAQITWDLPTDGAVVVQTDVSFSADGGANYVFLSSVLPTDAQQLVIPDLVDGGYSVRLVVVGENGSSPAVDTTFDINTAVPGPVTNVQVTLL